MKKTSKIKRTLSLVLCLLLCISAVACSKDDNSKPDASKPGNSQSEATPTRTDLNVRTADTIGILIPYQATKLTDYTLNWNIYDNLVKVVDRTYAKVVPSLAERWEISEDGLEYTFYLRKDVDFHNGEHFTAEDVAYTWTQFKDSAARGYQAVNWDSWEVLDEYTIKLRLINPDPGLLQTLANEGTGIVNKKTVEQYGVTEEAYVGTGPYKLETYNPNELIVLTANEDYFDGVPAIKTINMKVVTDNNSALIMFKNGELDELHGISSLDRQALEKNSNVRVLEESVSRVGGFLFNTNMAPLDNIYVRQAFNYALDRETLCLIGSEGVNKPAQLPIVADHDGYTTEVDYEYNPEKAKELLKKSGLSSNELVITLTHSLEADIVKLATTAQSQLQEVGFTVNLEGIERTVLVQKILAKEVAIGTFTYGAVQYSPQMTFEALVSTSGSWALSGYTGPRADEMNALIKNASAEMDQAKRVKMYEDAMKIFREDALTAPCWNLVTLVAVDSDLEGMFYETAALTTKYEWCKWN